MIDWDDHAKKWDDDDGARAYAEAAFGSLERLLESSRLQLAGASVCDFGCGTGLLTERLAAGGGSIDAVDSSEGMLDVLRDKVVRHQLKRVRPRADLTRDGRLYDLVVCSSVCGFLFDYPGTVGRLAARLRPGGLFVQWDWESEPEGGSSTG